MPAITSISSVLAAPTAAPTASLTPRPTSAEAIRRIYAAGIQLSVVESEIGSLAEMLADGDPEVVAHATAELEAKLAAEEGGRLALVERCDAALALADMLIGQSALRRAQAKRLQTLAQTDEAQIERLQEIAIKVLRLAHPSDTRITLPMHELKSRKSEVVAIDEDLVAPEKLPEKLRRTKYEFDKTAIKDFLKKGGTYEGLSLVQRRNWSVDC